MKILRPINLALYRASECIELCIEFVTPHDQVRPKEIYVRVGHKTITLDLQTAGQHPQGLYYKASALYRAGYGLKRFVFIAMSYTGIKTPIGNRYVIVRSGDIGPRVFIPRSSKKITNGINVIGSLNYEFGLGEAARGMVQAVRHAGIPNNAILAPMVRNSGKNIEFDYTGIDRSLSHKINLFNLNAPDMQLVRKRWPRVFTNGQYNVGYWYYELPQLPESWLEGFKGLHEVWVASKFVYEAVRAVSPVPVYVIPPVVVVALPTDAKRSEFNLPEDKLCVLSVFDLNSFRQRKNPEAAIEAFKIAYAHNRDLHLVLKVNNADRNLSSLKILRDKLQGLDCVTLITEVLPRVALSRLQATCDVFISLHRSEGFGLNLAECMALGKPIIATHWSANVDYMNSANSCPVDYTLVKLTETIGPYENGQIWAEPSIEHAAEYIVALAANDKLRAEVGERAKATIEAQYSLSSVAKTVLARYAAISNQINN